MNIRNQNNNKNYDSRENLINSMSFGNFKKTSRDYKLLIAFFLGIFPMLLFWLLFGGGDGSNFIFKNVPGTPYIPIDIGYQWLIAITVAISIMVILYFLAEYSKNINHDLYGLVLSLVFIIINFWLFEIGNWRFLTVVFMFLAGYLIGISISFMFMFKKIRTDFSNLNKKMEDFFEEDHENKNNKNKDDDFIEPIDIS